MPEAEVLVVRDPQVAKLLADDTRRKILLLLRVAEMTPQQIARLLKKNVSSITHHLSMLEGKGLVKVARVEVRRNLVVKWYKAAARRIIVSYELAEGLVPGSEEIAKHVEDAAMKAAETLVEVGVKLSGEEVEEAAALIKRIYLMIREVYEKLITKCLRCDDPWSRALLLNALMAVELAGKREFAETVSELRKLLGEQHG